MALPRALPAERPRRIGRGRAARTRGRVVGASGAIFGLFGALLVIERHIGANIRNIAIVIGINLLWPFASALVSSIGRGSFTEALAAIQVSWQAHLGGLLTGALVGLIFARPGRRERRAAQIWLLVGVGVGLLALLVIPPLLTLIHARVSTGASR